MNIFPVKIEMAELSNNIDNESLINYAYDLKNNDNGRIVSNRGGWQSNNLDFNNISSLMVEIMGHISGYSSSFNLKKNTSIQFTSSWLNINPQYTYNINHTHTGWVSGVYYAKADPNLDMGELTLHHPGQTKTTVWDNFWYESFNDDNCGTFNIKPKTGLLVLFPSWLEHSVEMNNSTEDRVSLSFNTKIELM